MLKKFGYLRVAAAKPVTKPVDISENTRNILSLMHDASAANCNITVYPELAISSYNCGDLFRQQALLDSVLEALTGIVKKSSEYYGIHIIGFPYQENGQLFNCAAAISRGEILGIIPKSFIPNNNEYYESRWFSSGLDLNVSSTIINGKEIPFGTDIVFSNKNNKLESFGIEICEDLWAPIPPSSFLSIEGASVIFNLSASTDIIGKAEYRRNLVQQQSASIIGAYVYCSAGVGESTTDTVCGGHSIIAENGKVHVENQRFKRNSEIIMYDIDLEYINHERLNNI
ncbi:MAG: NAD(+) synthase, partial [Spirochaetaceae bacterium]|nr:NAD(+) synthase [Spirochaetaceae bacterium]